MSEMSTLSSWFMVSGLACQCETSKLLPIATIKPNDCHFEVRIRRGFFPTECIITKVRHIISRGCNTTSPHQQGGIYFLHCVVNNINDTR